MAPNQQLPNDFEIGPIRPPSEAGSLLLRVTRNCPWNRCSFCPVYKGQNFSLRTVADVLRDVETARQLANDIQELSWKLGLGGTVPAALAQRLWNDPAGTEGFRNVVLFLLDGARSVFLQDANTLITPPDQLETIVRAISTAFPRVERITSYARSHTAAHRRLEDLQRLRTAGLSRIHAGLESGSDPVLKFVAKGATAQQQIEGGLRLKQAGFELSEYVMPGLGGRRWSAEHAAATARALVRINPHFIRLRSLALPQSAPLRIEREAGRFDRLGDVELIAEIGLFVEQLDGFTGILHSDHILNALPGIEGQFPQDRGRVLARIRHFLDLPDEEQRLFLAGRRLGVFDDLSDLTDPARRRFAERTVRELTRQPQGFQAALWELSERFI